MRRRFIDSASPSKGTYCGVQGGGDEHTHKPRPPPTHPPAYFTLTRHTLYYLYLGFHPFPAADDSSFPHKIKAAVLDMVSPLGAIVLHVRRNKLAPCTSSAAPCVEGQMCNTARLLLYLSPLHFIFVLHTLFIDCKQTVQQHHQCTDIQV